MWERTKQFRAGRRTLCRIKCTLAQELFEMLVQLIVKQLHSSGIIDSFASDVSPWPWFFKPKSKSLALIPQVFGLGLDLVI